MHQKSRPPGRLFVVLRPFLGTEDEGAIGFPPPQARPGRRGGAAAGFARLGGSPNGLEPVLAERGEIDQQIDGVGQPSP